MSTSREQLSTDDLHSKCRRHRRRRRRPLRILKIVNIFISLLLLFIWGGKPPEGGKRTFLVKVTGKFGE